MQWSDFRKHLDQVVADRGQSVWLLNEDGEPLFELPAPTSLTAPQTRLSPASLQMQVPSVTRVGTPHRVTDELVAGDLGRLDAEGRLQPANGPTRMIAVVREGGRRAYKITHVDAEGVGMLPTSLTIHGVDLLDLLDAHPCPSAPFTWEGGFELADRDFVRPFDEPRLLGDIELAVVADGFSVAGPAEETIRNLIQSSIDAVNRMMGWQDDPHLVVDMTPTGLESPHVVIRPQDDSIWRTIEGYCLSAGVAVWVDLWWPGDAPVNGTVWDRPIGVVRVQQIERRGA